MPRLGNKKYAYTKKGVAAYKAAKKKGSKMNESARKRLLDLMVESSAARRELTRSIASKIAGVSSPKPYNASPASRGRKSWPKKAPHFGRPFDHPTGNADMQKRLAASKPSFRTSTYKSSSVAAIQGKQDTAMQKRLAARDDRAKAAAAAAAAEDEGKRQSDIMWDDYNKELDRKRIANAKFNFARNAALVWATLRRGKGRGRDPGSPSPPGDVFKNY